MILFAGACACKKDTNHTIFLFRFNFICGHEGFILMTAILIHSIGKFLFEVPSLGCVWICSAERIVLFIFNMNLWSYICSNELWYIHAPGMYTVFRWYWWYCYWVWFLMYFSDLKNHFLKFLSLNSCLYHLCGVVLSLVCVCPTLLINLLIHCL